MVASSQLTSDFINAFNISSIVEQKPKSGQKQVFIVYIDGIKYALKIIPVKDERIVRELKIYDEFKDNPGIPCVIDIKEYGEELVVLEEYIDGDDLHLIKNKYLNNNRAVRELIYKIARILEPVWNRNYIHRDLKPQNIRIKDGDPIVLDFGIARDLDDESITPTGFQPFSWPFGAPEQFFYKKEQISYRTDFFCLGIIAYYLYTGVLPFGTTKSDVANVFIGDQITYNVNDDVLNRFFNATLRFRVADRPRNVEAFIKLLGI